MNLIQARKRVNRAMADWRAAKKAHALAEVDLAEAREEETAILEAQEVINEVATAVQERMHRHIARIVGLCLRAVFEDPYEFRIRFEKRRGKTEARMVFSRDGSEYDDPINEVGGGVIDVVSLALRIAVICLKPRLRRCLILDEPFRNIRGRGNRRRTRGMLEKLAQELGFQFVLNTDIPEYRLGRVIEVSGHEQSGESD